MTAPTTMKPAANYGILTDLDTLGRYVDGVLTAGRWVGFDLETGYHGPLRRKGALMVDWDKQLTCGFAFSHELGFGRYVPLAHDPGGNVSDPTEAWKIMKPLLTRGKLVIHNRKFEDRNVLKSAGYRIGSAGGEVVDTMLDAYVLSEFRVGNSTQATHSLKELTKLIFGHEQTQLEQLFVGWSKKDLECLRFNVLELTPEVVSYVCEDAAWALALKGHYSAKAQHERKAIRRVEHLIAKIMADVERYGVGVDWDSMRAMMAEATTFAPAMEASVKEGFAKLLARRREQEHKQKVAEQDELDLGTDIDVSKISLGSSQQMQRLLYRDLGFATTRMTKDPSGKKVGLPAWQRMSTDATAMEGLSKKHPEVRQLLAYREVGNNVNRLELWLNEASLAVDGRVHANYNQVRVGTGRFAANDPPIQQCPKELRWTTRLGIDPFKDEEAWAKILEEGQSGVDYWTYNFRDFIVAAPNTYLLTYDYSQIELRVLAGESQEPALLRAFNEGQDVHRLTAAMMLGKKPEDVDDKERQIGKTQNFALLYGMGPQHLAESLGISMDRAKELRAQYFAAFSRIESWQDATRTRGMRVGYSETRFGRKYTVWELLSDSPAIRAKGERVLTNAPIQGGAADYMKLAMIRAVNGGPKDPFTAGSPKLSGLIDRGWWGSKCTIVMNQHDSLTFEVSDQLDPREVRMALEDLVVFPVPNYPIVVADWELGQRWGSSTKWKKGMSPRWDGQHWKLVVDEEPPALAEMASGESLESVASEGQNERHLTAVSGTTVSTSGITIVTTNMPTREGFRGLLDLMRDNPGSEEVWLRCPEGEVQLGTSSISDSHQAKISLLLQGATLEIRSAVDLSSVTANLSA